MDNNFLLLAPNAPRVALALPVVGGLRLEAILDTLLEQSVLVAYSVAVKRKAERRSAVQEARCKSAQTAVAERRILYLLELVYTRDELLQTLGCGVQQIEAQQVIVHRSAYQELH